MTAAAITFLVLLSAPGGVAPDAGTSTLSTLRRLARQLKPEVSARWVRAWLDQADSLVPLTPSTWDCPADGGPCQPASGPGPTVREVNDELAYARIADPLGYTRPLELAAGQGFHPAGGKILDFGYGNLGQLVMLAGLGAEVHGIEVDPLLPVAARHVKPPAGRVVVHHGRFPADAAMVEAVGSGYGLWLSKNTLKRGYVHPAEPRGATPVIDLGSDDGAVLRLIHSQLEPGGLFVIYNITAPRPGQYRPMADGRCPFSREDLAAAGFTVVAYDADDSPAARRMAARLEWAADWPDVATTLRATFTIARRPR